MTISRCAWEAGVFMADAPWVLDSIESVGSHAAHEGVVPIAAPWDANGTAGGEARPLDEMAVSCFCTLSAECLHAVQRSVWVECKLLLLLHHQRLNGQMDTLCRERA